ncbi:MAG: amidinotransferase [Deltaproteobacteria bacterium]|nr:amidinotransferase [Deltaproteobacteria bacterium]
MLKSEADRLRRVIVCTPHEEYCKASNLKEHNILEVAIREKAIVQHNQLKTVLTDFGVEVIDVPELVGHPNSVFTRDTAICTPEGYIEVRPGITTREAEGKWMSAVLDRLGEPRVSQINPPGSVDGGDVVLWNHVAFVGLSKRTNKEGIRQLTKDLVNMGYNAVVTIPLPDTILHLDKVLMPVSTEQLLVCGNIVPHTLLKDFKTITVDYNDMTSANIICLGDGELVVDKKNLGVINRLKNEAVTLNLLDISEFAKGFAGPNCLIMPLERTALIP